MAEPFLINGSGGAIDKLGVIAAEQVWEVDSEAECVSYSPEHPLRIPILERSWREQPHGKQHVTLKFEGVSDVATANGNEDYEGDSGSTEDPIESIPWIDRLIATYPHEEKDGRIIWAQKMTDSQTGKEGRNKMYGVEAYRTSNPTWTQHKLYAELPDDLYEGLDCIVPAGPPGPDGKPVPIPKPANNDLPPRNWRLERVVPRKRGNIWQVSRTWALSGPGGWNDEVYTEK